MNAEAKRKREQRKRKWSTSSDSPFSDMSSLTEDQGSQRISGASVAEFLLKAALENQRLEALMFLVMHGTPADKERALEAIRAMAFGPSSSSGISGASVAETLLKAALEKQRPEALIFLATHGTPADKEMALEAMCATAFGPTK